ncbi:MAG: DUF4160 domain-containing protein [Desulfobacterium sp.]|nr:DUF4160 domain-containing protein [Desulfobacterium sp.]
MPTISMFYEILVSIFFEDNVRHHLPHIHARYQGKKASVSINDGAVLAGSSNSNWELAVCGEEPFRIEPLR